MLLAYAIDFIEDETYTDWLNEPTQTPDLSDLVIFDFVDDFTTDTNVWCEFYDADTDTDRTGIIQSWHDGNPADYFSQDDSDYAYIICDDGGATYAPLHFIQPIAEVLTHENTLPVRTAVRTPSPLPAGRSSVRNVQESDLFTIPASSAFAELAVS